MSLALIERFGQCDVMSAVSIMISSTIRDLSHVRDAVGASLASTGFADLVGVAPGKTVAHANSSYGTTIDVAETCGAYMLILGGRYGFEVRAGKSATQLEYEAAIRSDPTKVIVLRQTAVRRDAKQRAFNQIVEVYHHGFSTSRFKTPDEAATVAKEAFLNWMVDRASVGRKLDYFDHFVRIASQRTPFPGARCLYRLTDDRVELTYHVVDRTYSVHFDKRQLYSDFWGSVYLLDERFDVWRADHFGQRPRPS